jgi:hypothetical protein
MPAPAVNTALHTYINDHLSGSHAALQLLDHLIANATDADRAFFTTLHAEVSADRTTLERVLAQSGGEPSHVRQAGGWLLERAGRLKLAFDDPSQQSLARLEAIEMLSLGVYGKRALWRALAVAARPDLRAFDFPALEQRADHQHQQIEARRLEAARRVLGAP